MRPVDSAPDYAERPRSWNVDGSVVVKPSLFIHVILTFEKKFSLENWTVKSCCNGKGSLIIGMF